MLYIMYTYLPYVSLCVRGERGERGERGVTLSSKIETSNSSKTVSILSNYDI